MKLLLCLLLALGAVVNASADGGKVAQVDVRKIFNEWKYSIELQQAIDQSKDALEKENNERLAVINELQMQRTRMHQEYKSNEASMTPEQKKKMDDAFKKLGRDAMALEQDRRDFVAKQRVVLGNEMSATARNIIDRILQAVQVHALAKKFDMVVEGAGETTRNTPLFLYLEGAEDITDEILTKLNAESAE